MKLLWLHANFMTRSDGGTPILSQRYYNADSFDGEGEQ